MIHNRDAQENNIFYDYQTMKERLRQDTGQPTSCSCGRAFCRWQRGLSTDRERIQSILSYLRLQLSELRVTVVSTHLEGFAAGHFHCEVVYQMVYKMLGLLNLSGICRSGLYFKIITAPHLLPSIHVTIHPLS